MLCVTIIMMRGICISFFSNRPGWDVNTSMVISNSAKRIKSNIAERTDTNILNGCSVKYFYHACYTL